MQYINYRESRQRGTADFPIEYHHVSPTHPQYIMALHWHVEFELIRILSGSLKLTVDEEEYTAKAGSSCFIPLERSMPESRTTVSMNVLSSI